MKPIFILVMLLCVVGCGKTETHSGYSTNQVGYSSFTNGPIPEPIIATNDAVEHQYRLPKDIQDRFDEINKGIEASKKRHFERIKHTAEAFYKKGFRDAEMMKESGQLQELSSAERVEKSWQFYAEKIEAINLEGISTNN